jgi:hypothetical protein
LRLEPQALVLQGLYRFLLEPLLVVQVVLLIFQSAQEIPVLVVR